MLLAARPLPHIHRSPWDRGWPVVQHRHTGKRASCTAWAAAAAAEQPDSRAGEGAGSAGSSVFSLSSSSSSIDSEEVAIAAVLASAGLDPAELQEQAPDAYDELCLKLAEVLAEVHAARVAKAKISLQLPPAMLVARICFLYWEVGLTAAEIRHGYCRNEELLQFDLDGARHLHIWLQLQHLTEDQLRLASRSYTRLWGTNVLILQCYKEHVQQQLSVTDSQWRNLFVTRPQSLLALPERVDGVIAWLEAKPLGFSRKEVARLWRAFPALFCLSADVLQQRLGQLASRFSLSGRSLRQVVFGSTSVLVRDPGTISAQLDSLLAAAPCLRSTTIPWLLCMGGSAVGYNADTVLSKIDFLRKYGFDEVQLSRMLARNPMVLSTSVEDKWMPNLAALEEVLGSQADVVVALAREPGLLVAALETLEGNVEVMKEQGMTSADIGKSVGKDPLLFAWDFKKQDFQDKLRYFEEVLGRSPRYMLGEVPFRLRTSLKKVDYRVSFIENKGDTHHENTLTWVPWGNERFCEVYKYDLDEYEGWREQWMQSKRATQYGLHKAKETGMARALQARKRRFRAKVDARREQLLSDGEL
ncbi:hypothetical protein N2152v2_000275 [Parachlorella kessleri]